MRKEVKNLLAVGAGSIGHGITHGFAQAGFLTLDSIRKPV
jgi:3-hydroxyacyl-CoA dehydrogenase